ncbi:prolactin-releasing peptide receptor-like isoform X2 [Stylophora pistillata]|uniref:Neuropeptide Y receptor n=2 Tax=Stylophora pistillata TaxID=50429 RepID=A0A2B4SVS8_STYPI|nr:prolactin-releasing peptide receptor-like isoform X2 [Stylophora pistillata]XP_022791299.1 prolactin-releasing peptide receptor-like isoform X2 [Stylophora pistillata]PFX33981.1 Neuropeptide Y receptor [Stylophora pistillata]
MQSEEGILNITATATELQEVSNSSSDQIPGPEPNSSFVIFTTIYAVIVFIVAVVGNSLVIYIVKTREYMRNSTNILIANMAIADILMACLFPYMLRWLYVGNAWFGTFMGIALCKFFHSAQVLSISCSVLNLVFISLDRCLVIWFPLRRIFTNKVLKACLVSSWVFSTAFAMPLIIMTTAKKDENGIYRCNEYNWPTHQDKIDYATSFTVLSYLIPLLIITIAYILIGVKLQKRELPGVQTLEYQKKAHETTKKAIIMLVTVVVVFALCWLPLQAREFMLNYFPQTISLFPYEVELFLPWIGVLNSAINPWLYVIFSENFRREFGRVLCCMENTRSDAYLGIPATRATPMTTPLMSRRMTTTPVIGRRTLSAANVHETLPLRHLANDSK